MKTMLKNRYVLLQIFAGNTLLAFSVCAFIVPNRFMLGGATGIALALQQWLLLPLSALTAVLNTVLFFLGLTFLGKAFAMTSLCSALTYPMILGLFERLPLEGFAGGKLLLSAVSAGVLMGIGIGIIIHAGGSTGGMDIPLCILKHYKGIPVGLSMIVFDLVILSAQVIAKGGENILYSIAIMSLTSISISLFQGWLKKKKGRLAPQ